MQHAAKLNFLHNLGVDAWWPCATKHPYFAQKTIKIELQPLQLGLRCVVLLPMYFHAIQQVPQATIAQNQICSAEYSQSVSIELSRQQHCSLKGERYTQREYTVPDWWQLLWKMLDVLALAADQIAIAKIYTTCLGGRWVCDHEAMNIDAWQQVVQEVAIWEPHTVLQFATDCKVNFPATMPVVSTLHPQHLQHNQSDKKIAYKELLKLKAIIGT